MLGAVGKASIERLCLSPYVKTFNSKVIKGFVHELRSPYMLFMFWDSYVLCIYVMNILCTFHISGYLAMLQMHYGHCCSSLIGNHIHGLISKHIYLEIKNDRLLNKIYK